MRKLRESEIKWFKDIYDEMCDIMLKRLEEMSR